MSTDYSAIAVFGYVANVEDLFTDFMEETPEEVAWEDRYDPKTGAKLEKQVRVVVREAGFSIVIGNRRFEGPDDGELCYWSPGQDLIEFLSNHGQCTVTTGGYQTHGGPFWLLFYPNGCFASDSSDPVSLEMVARSAELLPPIRLHLQELGLDIGEPGIHALLDVT